MDKKIKIIKFDTISSTSLYLKDNYENLESNTVAVARCQTSGRGRLGRSWTGGDDILMSILLKDRIDQDIEKLSLVVCASLFKTISRHLENTSIKWPNDILVNNKKISGVLLEAVTKESLECIVIGIGINVNTKNYSDELYHKATSFFLETAKEWNKDLLMEEVINDFYNEYELYKNNKSSYLEICKKNSYLINKKVYFIENDSEKEAIVLDIDENGKISLLIDGKVNFFNHGEISLERIYKK